MKFLLECNGVGAFVTVSRDDTAEQYGIVQRAFQQAVGRGSDRHAYVAMIRFDGIEHAEGVAYTWGLAGPQGAYFELIALPDTPALSLEKAKAKIRREQDVVQLSVRRIKRMIEMPSV